MTLPSQFSVEEENFYKDIQDLLKNSSQNEKELSLFLQRYMDLLAKADLDDESFIINFTKAGLIIEASAKVYGTKVDRLWNNLEHVLMSLRSKSDGQGKNKPLGDDEMEVEGDGSRRRLSMNCRRRKKVGDALVSADDFVEIDNVTGLLGKNMNENVNKSPGNLKFCEKVPNMFIKNKLRKKRIDVCLNNNVDEKDIIRLRDWVVTTECLLVKEIQTYIPGESSTNESCEPRLERLDCMELDKSRTMGGGGENEENDRAGGTMIVESLPENAASVDFNNESHNAEAVREKSIKEPTLEENLPPDKGVSFLSTNDCNENYFNISKESDLAKFPNVLNRGPKACLVDVDEVFWDPNKFRDMIPSKKLRSGKSFNPPCKLCKTKQVHQGKKKCVNKKRKSSGLDLYFIPHVQPSVGEPQFGILPDEELISAFKQEMKIIEQLIKVNAARNINEAFHPDEDPEKLKNFLGFDGFEKRFLRMSECNEEEVLADYEDNNQNEEHSFADEPPPEVDFELPVPVIEDSVRYRIISTDDDPGPKDDDHLAETEYQKLVKEGLKDHYEAKSIFAKNKELGIKISNWHEMISDKIKLSEKRGAMNMNTLANKILSAFPSPLRGELPQMSFRELVKNQTRRDIPRYFFGCLQLTNEGNLDISKTDPRPLATDCMVITQLRTTRKNCDLDESTAKTPTKERKTPETNRKRSSMTRSPITIENKSPWQAKRVKQRTEKAFKRQKNFTAVNNSKKISESTITPNIEQTQECEEYEEYENETTPLMALDEHNDRENLTKTKKPSDDFQKIDIDFSGKDVNERVDECKKVKLCDDVYKMFVKPKIKKKTHAGDENTTRLRNWSITPECFLVKEIFSPVPGHKNDYSDKNEEEEEESRSICLTEVGSMQDRKSIREKNLIEECKKLPERIKILQKYTYKTP